MRGVAIGALVAAVAAEDMGSSSPVGKSWTDNYSNAPYNMEPQDFALLMRQTVARGEYKFQGPNISEPYPTGAIEDMRYVDWAVNVDIATNISLRFGQNDEDDSQSSDYVSGGVLSLTPTEGEFEVDDLDETFYPDPSWKICVYYPVLSSFWQEKDQTDTHKKDECQRTVPDDCASAIRAKLAGLMMYNSSEANGDSDGCPAMWDPPEPCAGPGDEYSINTWNHTLFRMGSARPNGNGTYPMFGPWVFDEETRDEINDIEYAPEGDGPPPYKNGSALFQWASAGGEAGNMTLLDQTGLTTPLFIAYGPNSTWINENAEDDYSEGNAITPQVEFVCGEVTETTVDYLDEVPEYSAGSRGHIAEWAVGGLSVAVALILA